MLIFCLATSVLIVLFCSQYVFVRSLHGLGHDLEDIGAMVKTLLLHKMTPDMQLLWCRRPKTNGQGVGDQMKFIQSEIEAFEL